MPRGRVGDAASGPPLRPWRLVTSADELAAPCRAYERLGGLTERPKLMVATYFGRIGAALPVLAAAPVEAVGLDFAAGPDNRETLAAAGGLGAKTLVAGVVDGRNVWRTGIERHCRW